MKGNGSKQEFKMTKKGLVIICVAILSISLLSIFAGYVLNKSTDFFSRTKEFYFNSDRLGENTPVYQIENWAGTSDYIITINMNSIGNDLLSASYDISYDISYTCSDNVICQLSKTSGVVKSITNTDYFTLRVIPNTQLQTGDKVTITITASANSPYRKTLTAEFNLVVGQEKISYEIVDSPYSPYLELSITNTLSYYTVSESFSTYLIGAKIAREVYLELPDADKAKCYSAIIEIAFDPNIILLDMTDSTYLRASNILKIAKNSYNYIRGMTFKVDAVTGIKIKFYKTDETQDYTYPKGNSSPIVTVTTT